MAGAAANGMTRITLSFLLSLLSDNNLGPNSPANSKHHWSYKGPEGPQNWPVHYEGCAGLKQSPIDIPTVNTVHDASLGKFHLDNFHTYSESNGPTMLNVTNNGHAASVRVTSNMRVSGGGLNGTYKTAEFHFHWGSTDDVGSEHAMDGRKFPLEMHIVNTAEKYGTIKEAMTKPDGLAVLGVFFELSDTDNLEFSGLGNALNYVQKAGEHNIVQRVRLRSLLPEDISRYWRYSGSLTTPMCFESVTWTVFATPQKISRSQLETLRSLHHENGHDKNDHTRANNPTPSRLVDNWRPVQPLNSRTVYRSFEDTYGSNIRHSGRTSENHIVSSEPSSAQQVSGSGDINLIKATTLTEQQKPGSGLFPSKSVMKNDPTSIPKINTVPLFASPTRSSLGKGNKEALNDFTRTQFQAETINDSVLRAKTTQYSLDQHTNVIEQLKKQQKMIELQTQQHMQKLMQLRQQQQQLNNELDSPTSAQSFGGMSSFLPNIQTLEAQNQPGRLAISGEPGKSLRNGARILNDGVIRGDQAIESAWPRSTNVANQYYQNKPRTPQQKQSSIALPSPPASQTQQRYVKPIDPNFRFNFLPKGFAQQGQQTFIPRHQQQLQQQTPVNKESPTPHNLRSQFQNQLQSMQLSDAQNSLFSQLNNPRVLRQNSPSAAFQQPIYRTYPKQQSLNQRQNTLSRQQQQQVQSRTQHQQQLVSGSKMSPSQLRTLLEKLAPKTRQHDGQKTLMSPAARVLASTQDINSISRPEHSARRGNANSRNTAKEVSRSLDQSKLRDPSTLTSGMNPIPYSSNKRMQRVPSQVSSRLPARSSPLSSNSLSLPSPASSSPTSTSFNYGNQPVYQYNRNRKPASFSRPGVNNNWFFTDRNGQGRQEELPYVFLHHIQKPVRIRRPFYERLYNI